MSFWQMTDFVFVKQDDGQQALIKYIVEMRVQDVFCVVIEKYVLRDGDMYFEERSESIGEYIFEEAFKLAQLFCRGRVFPATQKEIELEMTRSI